MSARPTRRRKPHLTTGAIALALLAPVAEPAVAGATEPDEEQETQNEGANETGPGEVGELTPGQGSSDNVVEENSPPLLSPGDNSDPNEGENENGPVESESQIPVQQVEGEPAPVAPVPPSTAPAPPVAPAPPIAQAKPSPPTAQTAPAPAPRTRVAPVRDRTEKSPVDRSPRRRRVAKPKTSPPRLARPAPALTAPVRPAARVTTPRTAPDSPAPARIPGPDYSVRAGDTLWSIASAQLGESASPAQIARQVQRLWNLNARAIGTGDPSLLRVGVQLRLR